MSKADKLLKRVEFYEKMASSQKPENDDLLKKASLFEKLALYSDRKSFLSALGGGATSNWGAKQHSDAEIKGALQRVVDGSNQWREQYGNRLVDASGSPRTFPQNIAQDQYNVSQALRLPSYDISTLNTIYKSLSNLAVLTNKGFERDALVAWQQLVGQAALVRATLSASLSNDSSDVNNLPRGDAAVHPPPVYRFGPSNYHSRPRTTSGTFCDAQNASRRSFYNTPSD